MKPRNTHDRGVALIPVLAMVLVVMALGSSALLTSTAHMKRIVLNRRSTQALEIAETGCARALYELERNQDLDSVQGIGNVSGDFGGGRFDATTTPMGNNYYRVRGAGQIRGVRRQVEMIAVGPETIYGKRALAAKDIPAALEAVGDLRSALPEAPESTLELARLLAQAGQLTEAMWLLDAGVRRYPDRKDLSLGLAEVSLLVGDADEQRF